MIWAVHGVLLLVGAITGMVALSLALTLGVIMVIGDRDEE